METLKRRRVEKFEIILEHDIDEQYQYVPGEMMKGAVVITVNDEIKINSLTITLQGEGNVVWEKDQQKGNKQNKFKSRELYLDYTEDIIRNQASSSGSVTLDPGEHEFVFYHQLSESLPSSYIGKYGSVTYLVKAQLRPDRKYGADAMITNEPFLVLRTYDLSLEPFKLQPKEERLGIPVGGGCLCGGRINAFVKINRTGFIPGEDIRLNADVANNSNIDITSLQASILLTSRFHANNSTISTDQVISKHEDQFAIEGGEGRRWNDVRLTIPPYIPESALEGCDIIDISYSLLFQVIIDYNSDPRKNLKVVIPITIGTHGVKVDDNPVEDPDKRPLYHRAPEGAADNRPSYIQRNDDDEMGEIDTSLFETEPTARSAYKAKFAKKSEEGQGQEEKQKANPVNFLYGDLVSASDLPDDKLEGTIRDAPAKSNKNSKKKRAPLAPGQTSSVDEDEQTTPANEEQTRL